MPLAVGRLHGEGRLPPKLTGEHVQQYAAEHLPGYADDGDHAGRRLGTSPPETAGRELLPQLAAAPATQRPGALRGRHRGIRPRCLRPLRRSPRQSPRLDTGTSKSDVSRICADLAEQLDAFRTHTLDHIRFPCLFVDATYVPPRRAVAKSAASFPAPARPKPSGHRCCAHCANAV